MDQAKIGGFLKTLRKEKNLTQEQLAEELRVARRTVSRWETGSNLPDLDVLVELSDFYSVDLRELLDGERKEKKMDQELEETVRMAADYSNEGKRKLKGRLHLLFIAGLVASVVYLVLWMLECADNFAGGLCQGITAGMMVVGVLMTSRFAEDIQQAKLRLFRRNRG